MNIVYSDHTYYFFCDWGRGGSIITSPLQNIEATEMKLTGFVVYQKIYFSHYDSVMSYETFSRLTFHSSFRHTLRKQLTFCNTTNSFPVKWCLRNEHRNSILMTCHWEMTLHHWWNFCASSSDIIFLGNHKIYWWCHENVGFFSQVILESTWNFSYQETNE